MRKEILVVGNSNIDFIFKVPRLHLPGETIIADQMITAFGGKGANQAITLKQLGAKVIFLTKIGNDPFGEKYRRYLIKKGINPKWILRDKASPTGMAIIELSSEGQNRIIVSPGANASLSLKDVEKIHLPWEKINLFLVQLEIPLETVIAFLKIAREKRIITLLNPSPAKKLSSRVLSMVDFLIPNEVEAEILSGMKIKRESDVRRIGSLLCELGSGNVAITLGEKGVFFKNQNEEIWMEAFKVDVIDTTAAGDAFLGAFAYGINEGWPIQKTLRFANASGALATTKLGAQPSLPNKKTLDDFISKHLK